MLRELPRQQRAALVLRYLLDLPDNQIADHLNCSPATVRSHVSHALATCGSIAVVVIGITSTPESGIP